MEKKPWRSKIRQPLLTNTQLPPPGQCDGTSTRSHHTGGTWPQEIGKKRSHILKWISGSMFRRTLDLSKFQIKHIILKSCTLFHEVLFFILLWNRDRFHFLSWMYPSENERMSPAKGPGLKRKGSSSKNPFIFHQGKNDMSVRVSEFTMTFWGSRIPNQLFLGGGHTQVEGHQVSLLRRCARQLEGCQATTRTSR